MHRDALVVLGDESDDVGDDQRKDADDEPKARLERLASLAVDPLGPAQAHVTSVKRSAAGSMRAARRAVGGVARQAAPAATARAHRARTRGTWGTGPRSEVRRAPRGGSSNPRTSLSPAWPQFPLVPSLSRPARLGPVPLPGWILRAGAAGCKARADENAAISSTFKTAKISC